MPYIGKAASKLYHFIDIPDELPDDENKNERKLLQSLIDYRSAWAGVKQKKSFWDKTKNKDYFEGTLLSYLTGVSEAEAWDMTSEQIKAYLIEKKLFIEFQNDEAIKAYLKRIKKTDNQSQLDFYFLMQKIPNFISKLTEATEKSPDALAEKQAEIEVMLKDKPYFFAAIPDELMGHPSVSERLKDIDIINGDPDFWLTKKPISEAEVRRFAGLFKPSELMTIIHERKQKGLEPLPLLEDARYISWFVKRLRVAGVGDKAFSDDYLEILKSADKYLMNGGRLTFGLQCLFDNHDWFSAMQAYRMSYELPFEDMYDLGRELLHALYAMFKLLLNITAILTTALLAVAIESALIAALVMFFEPHTFISVLALSQTFPGGVMIFPAVVLGTLGLMVATASVATGMLTNLLRETPGLPSEVLESFSRLGARIYMSLAHLFNQGVTESSNAAVSVEVSLPEDKDDQHHSDASSLPPVQSR